MPATLRSSRRRYQEYRRKLKQRRARQQGEIAPTSLGPHGGAASDSDEKKPHRRSRSFFSLFKKFWGLLEGHHTTIIVSLILAGIATLLAIAPFYGTKIVFDSVLNDRPLP